MTSIVLLGLPTYLLGNTLMVLLCYCKLLQHLLFIFSFSSFLSSICLDLFSKSFESSLWSFSSDEAAEKDRQHQLWMLREKCSENTEQWILSILFTFIDVSGWAHLPSSTLSSVNTYQYETLSLCMFQVFESCGSDWSFGSLPSHKIWN